jgi:ABC-2 type transport system permease protein
VVIVKLQEHDVPRDVSVNSAAPQPGLRPATASASASAGNAGAPALPNQLGQWPRKSALSGVRFVEKTLVIAELEARKLRHEPTELLTRAVQPALWLLVFGEVFSRVRAIPTGNLSYLDFMAPGVLAQSVLFISIFYGIAIIWERDLGILHKFLAAPVPRSALVLGKALSAGVRALSQALIVFVLAVLLGVDVSFRPLDLLGVVVTVILGAALFSSFSLIIACLVKTRERFMGIGQVLTMPLFFASNAIYPIAMMPAWLQVIARLNPLTYEVDALRTFMLATGVSAYGVGQDLLILTVVTAGLVVIGGRLYPTVI